MNPEENVIQTLKNNSAPMSAGQIAEASGMDRKEVDKAMNVLKKSGKITSPKRCFWTVA